MTAIEQEEAPTIRLCISLLSLPILPHGVISIRRTFFSHRNANFGSKDQNSCWQSK